MRFGPTLRRKLGAAAMLAAASVASPVLAEAIVTPAPMESLGGRSILLSHDFGGIETLPGYRHLLARKLALPPESPFGGAPRVIAMRSAAPASPPLTAPTDGAGEDYLGPARVRDVLHSIVNTRAARTAPQSRPAHAEEGDGAEALFSFDLRQYLLDNETLGGMLRSVLEPLPGEDGIKRFTVLGYGRWVVENEGGEGIRVTELNSGSSAELALDRAAAMPAAESGRAAAPSRQGQEGGPKRHIVAIILDYVTSPIGIFLMIAGSWVLLFALASKFIVMLRPRRF
jgi:hypothetical protein